MFVIHARQSDRAIVDLLTIHCVRLQFFIRTKIIKASVNNIEIIFHYFFLLFFFKYCFFYKFFLLYLPIAEKKLLVLVSNNLRTYETR